MKHFYVISTVPEPPPTKFVKYMYVFFTDPTFVTQHRKIKPQTNCYYQYILHLFQTVKY